MATTAGGYYVLHDHLYSPVALVTSSGTVAERYEYDAYGKATVYTNMADWDTATPTTQTYSALDNPYLFTGRRQDNLDYNSATGQYDYSIMYYRNRYYDTETGRFLTHDPLGIKPHSQKPNRFLSYYQFRDGLNLYEYVKSRSITQLDLFGLAVCGSCHPPNNPKDNVYNRKYLNIGWTAGLSNPDVVSNGLAGLEHFSKLTVWINDVLDDINVTSPVPVLPYFGPGTEKASEMINELQNLAAAKGRFLWYKIRYESCDPCWSIIGGCGYKMKEHKKWHPCPYSGSVIGAYPGKIKPDISIDDEWERMRDYYRQIRSATYDCLPRIYNDTANPKKMKDLVN